jgi:hypothetical protein
VYDTFDEAGRDFFNRILAMIDRGCSEQIISTGCWVGPMHAPGITTTPFPVMFWDFKNIVAEEGWIDGRGNWLGKPVQPVPVPG